MSVCVSSTNLGSFARVFWENQKRAATVHNSRSMRWDPLMIRWCLYLRHLSSSTYELLRESGVMKLPSQRTLRVDYTYIARAKPGFGTDIDAHLLRESRIDTRPPHERHVILLMDEMHIREDLVSDQHGRFNCFVCRHNNDNKLLKQPSFYTCRNCSWLC